MVSLDQNHIIIRFEGPGSLSIEFRVHLSKVENFLNSTNFDKLGLDRVTKRVFGDISTIWRLLGPPELADMAKIGTKWA